MSDSSLAKTFDDAADIAKRRPKKKLSPPLSIRVTEEERARLSRDAGKLSLSAFIRQKLFGDTAAPRKPRYRRKQRHPTMDSQTVAQLLGTFGQSELGRSMIALALAAQSGALPVTPELTEKLEGACEDIRNIRIALIGALNVKPEDVP